MMRFFKYVTGLMLSTCIYSQIPIQTFTLPSGLTCKFIENHEKPLVRIELVNKWGTDGSTLGKNGLGGLLATVIDTINSNKDNNNKSAISCIDLSFRANMGSYHWNLTTDSSYQELAIKLLADTVIHPDLNPIIVEECRQNLFKQNTLISARYLALNKFLYSIEDPTVLLPIELKKTNTFNYQNLIAFKQLAIRPENSVIAIYGDLNLAQAKQLVMLHWGTWSLPKISTPPKFFFNNDCVSNLKITTIKEIDSNIELLAGAPRPNCDVSQAVSILLPIVLDRTAKTLQSKLQLFFCLSDNLQSLLIKTQTPKIDQNQCVIEFISLLDQIQKCKISPEELRRALIHWRAENAALSLHPSDLTHQLVNNRLDPELLKAIELITVEDLNQAIKLWLKPERVNILLLGAETPKEQDIKKAGLLDWTGCSPTP
jgi:predicted Zn-dependent peptidase